MNFWLDGQAGGHQGANCQKKEQVPKTATTGIQGYLSALPITVMPSCTTESSARQMQAFSRTNYGCLAEINNCETKQHGNEIS